MKPLLISGLVVATLFAPSLAQAHFIWAYADPVSKQLRLEVAESPGESIVPMLGKFMTGIHSKGIGPLVDSADHSSLSASFQPHVMAGGVDLVYGIHGESLIHWSAKGASTLDAAGHSIGLPSEILLRRTKTGFVAVVTKGGKPAAGAQFEAYLPGAKPLQLKTAANGTVRLPAVAKGLLAVSAIVTEPVRGDYHGKPYKDTANMCSLTVRI